MATLYFYTPKRSTSSSTLEQTRFRTYVRKMFTASRRGRLLSIVNKKKGNVAIVKLDLGSSPRGEIPEERLGEEC